MTLVKKLEAKIEELKTEIDADLIRHLQHAVDDIKYELSDEYDMCEDAFLLNELLEDIDQVQISVDITYKD